MIKPRNAKSRSKEKKRKTSSDFITKVVLSGLCQRKKDIVKVSITHLFSGCFLMAKFLLLIRLSESLVRAIEVQDPSGLMFWFGLFILNSVLEVYFDLRKKTTLGLLNRNCKLVLTEELTKIYDEFSTRNFKETDRLFCIAEAKLGRILDIFASVLAVVFYIPFLLGTGGLFFKNSVRLFLIFAAVLIFAGYFMWKLKPGFLGENKEKRNSFQAEQRYLRQLQERRYLFRNSIYALDNYLASKYSSAFYKNRKQSIDKEFSYSIKRRTILIIAALIKVITLLTFEALMPQKIDMNFALSAVLFMVAISGILVKIADFKRALATGKGNWAATEESKGTDVTFPRTRPASLELSENLGIVIKDLEVETFDHVPLLSGVNLEVYPGETVAIEGDKDSGTTALFDTIIGRNKNYKGIIKIGTMEISEIPEDSRSKIMGIIFSTLSIYYGTVGENIALNRKIHSDSLKGGGYKANYSEDKINDIISKIGFSELIGRLPNGIDTLLAPENVQNLSRPDREILAWGLALSRIIYKKPSIVLCDVPEFKNSTYLRDPFVMFNCFLKLFKGTTIYFTENPVHSEYAKKHIMLREGLVLTGDLGGRYGYFSDANTLIRGEYS